MKVLYHGTSYESLLQIINNIINDKDAFNSNNKTWFEFSDSEYVYFHDDDAEYKTDEPAKLLALQSAQITASFQNSQFDLLGLIRIDIPDELMHIVEPDKTEDSHYAQSIKIETLNQLIKDKKLTIDDNFHYRYVPDAYDHHISYLYTALMSHLYKNAEMPEFIQYLQDNSIVLQTLSDFINTLITDKIEDVLPKINI